MGRKNIMQIAAGAFSLGWMNFPKLIALTFDDGPSSYTEALLDGFRDRHVVGTFFMNGENGTGGTCGIKNGHEALLSRMWEDGHQMANHTYRHSSLRDLPVDQILSEVASVEELIFRAAGGEFECFVRTPYGYVNKMITDNVDAPIILWSANTQDWKYRDADYVYNKILSCARGGAILLMHDIYKSSVEGALRAVDALKEKKYEFVTVSELMRRTGVRLEKGTVYSRAKRGFHCLPSYQAPEVKSKKGSPCGLVEISCSAPAGLSVYYTTDGTYPKLSGHRYNKAVLVEAGTVFTAIGVDQWGTRTPAMTVTAGEKE